MIQSIQLKDFRGIHQGEIDRFSQFNLLVGPNNAGKSTLLEALYLAGTAGRDAGLITQEHTYEVGVPGRDMLGYHPFSRVWTRHGLAERQTGLARWDDGLLRVEVKDRRSALRSFTLGTKDGFAQGEEQVIPLFSLGPTEQNLEQGAEKMVEELVGPDVLPFEDKSLFFCWHPELTFYRQGSAAWVVQGGLPAAQYVFLFSVDTIQSHLLLDFYQQMLAEIPGWSHRIARHFGSIFGIGEPFSVTFLPPVGQDGRWEQGWITPQERAAMPVDLYGDGVRAAFKLLTPLVALADLVTEEASGLVLWEEPELFQHPQTLGRLLREVVEIVRGKPIQFFISTQSLEVVAFFTKMLQEGRVDVDKVMTFRLALEEGILRSSWFAHNNLIAWLSDGLDPRVWGTLVSPVQYRLQEEAL